MNRVIAYVDGFNLYFGMKEAFGSKYLWLDVPQAIIGLLNPDHQLVKVNYFTSMVKNNPGKEERQRTYLGALAAATGCTTYFGQFRQEPKSCRSCGSTWVVHNEKMTDVNIATTMLMDAFQGRMDTIVLVTADSDLVPPLHNILAHFPDIQIWVCFPPGRGSKALKERAHVVKYMGKKLLRQSQLPNAVTAVDGFVLQRPPTWR